MSTLATSFQRLKFVIFKHFCSTLILASAAQILPFPGAYNPDTLDRRSAHIKYKNIHVHASGVIWVHCHGVRAL